jgi:ABC-type polysaccharide/polyol phosphate transport system ATPase subunit
LTLPIIECRGVSKAFVLRTNRQYLLKDRVLGRLRPKLRGTVEQFWALQDINIAVDAREAFAIIGANGAGKTTLSRIIAGIFRPTAGSVEIRGRIAPLLSLGASFHSELTGRENIYLSAALYGFTTPEIRQVEAAVIDFSELGHFIDVPIKNYSSGMQMRLGFSIAAQLRPDVFLLDEVLGVGDAHFQQKSLCRLEEERLAGRTFVVVTHDLEFVRQKCNRAALLVNGRVAGVGAAPEIVQRYRDMASA